MPEAVKWEKYGEVDKKVYTFNSKVKRSENLMSNMVTVVDHIVVYNVNFLIKNNKQICIN